MPDPQKTLSIPNGVASYDLVHEGKCVSLTNLNKVFWPESGQTKRDLLTYYVSIADVLIPHLLNRAVVMKRYPNGIAGKFFFMKRTPSYSPDWLRTCPIEHAKGNTIDFPMAQDVPSLLWIINLGCIDLNPWYSTCADANRPDVLNFDLDPVPPAGFPQVRAAALLVKKYLDDRGVSSFAKTTGSRGIHIYVPLRCGPLQKEVWTVAKRVAIELAKAHGEIITAEYRIAKRPAGRVLVDYNQNAWGRTLASVYSVRPKPGALVSAPVSWDEVEHGINLEDLTMDTVPERVQRLGDLFGGVTDQRERCSIERFA